MVQNPSAEGVSALPEPMSPAVDKTPAQVMSAILNFQDLLERAR